MSFHQSPSMQSTPEGSENSGGQNVSLPPLNTNGKRPYPYQPNGGSVATDSGRNSSIGQQLRSAIDQSETDELQRAKIRRLALELRQSASVKAENFLLKLELDKVKSQLQQHQTQLKSALDTELKCVICSERMIEAVVSGVCGHSFCKSCIDRWMQVKPECPTCRSECNRTAPAVAIQQLHEKLLDCLDAESQRKYAEAVETRKKEPPPTGQLPLRNHVFIGPVIPVEEGVVDHLSFEFDSDSSPPQSPDISEIRYGGVMQSSPILTPPGRNRISVQLSLNRQSTSNGGNSNFRTVQRSPIRNRPNSNIVGTSSPLLPIRPFERPSEFVSARLLLSNQQVRNNINGGNSIPIGPSMHRSSNGGNLNFPTVQPSPMLSDSHNNSDATSSLTLQASDIQRQRAIYYETLSEVTQRLISSNAVRNSSLSITPTVRRPGNTNGNRM